MKPEEKPVTPETPKVPDTPEAEPTVRMVGGVEEYSSSEEFQRAHAASIAEEEAKKQQAKLLSDKQKVKAFLDKYIDKYSKTTTVRALAKQNKKSADHQLDVCADVVEILEKIKNAVR